ncbi:MAG: fumarylacetoacetate hydrolase family protein [Acidimicrobiia bacterium]|nr:MAG: fumarylacetoacetate hydrolase family protein [Acidimicrobiia bacterium]
MRWAKYAHEGTVATGRVEGEAVVPTDAPSPLAAVLDGAADAGTPIALADVALMAPLDPIRNVLCVGWNYLPHFEEGAVVHGDRELPTRPNFFSKMTGSVIGPFDRIPSHQGVTEKLDWEVELGVVIGKQVVDLTPENALDAVAGYVVAQDISAREVQLKRGGQWFKGKSLDGTCPIGPWLVDAKAIDDPQDLDLSCSVNGAVKQSSNTRHMIFDIVELLVELSAGSTLYPGDLFLSGTPEGVGQSRTPPEFLQPGDVLESTVEGIGTIRNPVA